MTDIRPIRNEDDYARALADIERYFDDEPEPGMPEGDRFDLLSPL
jgi:HTH-type transcriptional regulator / antitoxin HigA